MKNFTATIQDTEGQLAEAVELPGWSHCGPPFRSGCSWYPFVADFRKIFFQAKNRTVAAKQCGRLNLYIRDLAEI